MTVERLDKLLDVLRGVPAMLILPHNDPDPDAIAGAVALRYLIQHLLGMQSEIAYKGIIGRAENRALVRELEAPLHPLWPSDLEQDAAIALVDTQLGAGNNALPAGRKAAIVLDHHPIYPDSSSSTDGSSSADSKSSATDTPSADDRPPEQAPDARLADVSFVDIRPEVGAISTMLLEYLQAGGLEPPPRLATALFYGINTDTRGLSRGASQADVDAYFYLQQRADVEMLSRIEQAQVPIDYFERLVGALQAAHRHEHLLVSYMGALQYPDLVAEMADLLLRLEGTRWVLCMGVHDAAMILSVRTRLAEGAAQLIRQIIEPRGTAGGHGSMAGGQIPLQGADADQLARTVEQRALYHLGIEPQGDGEPLIANRPCPDIAPSPDLA